MVRSPAVGRARGGQSFLAIMDLHRLRAFWITGLSGAGKSTLADCLKVRLRKQGIHPVILDGDITRDLLVEPMGHDRASRLRVAFFNARLCRFLALQGHTVICPTISLFHEVQAWNRKNIPGYVEIFLDAQMDILRRRDPKRIYASYEHGELCDVVGLDIPAEFPLSPDLRFMITSDTLTEQLVDQINQFINGQVQ